MGDWKSGRGYWRMEALRLLPARGQMSNLCVWSGSEDVGDWFRSWGTEKIVSRLFGGLSFADILPDPAWIKQTVQLSATDCAWKAQLNIWISFFNLIWDSGVNRRLKKTDAKGPRRECAGRTFHSCLRWDPLSGGTVSDSYRRGLSLRGERQKWYLNNSRWMIDRHLEMRGESSAKVSSTHCLRVANVRLALITVFVSYPSLSAARSPIRCVSSV